MAAAVVALALGVLTACTQEPPDVAYIRKVGEARTQKNQFFRGGTDSPVKPADYDTFLPLNYFDVDPSYAPPGNLRLIEPRTKLVMPTSTGKQRDMERIGYIEFTLKGETMRLTAFAEAGEPTVSRLFVPFSDLTSGTETYAAGRYMELDRTPTGLYNIDFNQAFNPWCYYNSTYDCPFPPKENRLPLPIRAGERLP